MVSDQELDALLKRLHLANTRRAWRDLARRAEQEDWTYHDFLTLLVTEEIAHRQQTRLERVVRRARFPFLKTIDDFNFLYQSTVRLSLLGSALSADFTTEGHCLIFNGKPGRGKTHLAIAIAYRAIQHGFDALFITAAELIDDLSAAFRAGRFAAALATYTHPAILVVDEVGYLTCGTDAANVLFHVVNDRHRKKRAMIFTTNKPLNQWGRVLHDEDLAHAIVDRVLERGRFLTLDGPSMRTKHLGIDDPTSEGSQTVVNQPARISGIQAPEFPEPTHAAWIYEHLRCGLMHNLVAINPWQQYATRFHITGKGDIHLGLADGAFVFQVHMFLIDVYRAWVMYQHHLVMRADRNGEAVRAFCRRFDRLGGIASIMARE